MGYHGAYNMFSSLKEGLLTPYTLLDVAPSQHQFTTSNKRNIGYQLIDVL